MPYCRSSLRWDGATSSWAYDCLAVIRTTDGNARLWMSYYLGPRWARRGCLYGWTQRFPWPGDWHRYVNIPHVLLTGVYGSSTNVSHGRAGLDCVVPTYTRCNWVFASAYMGRTRPRCVAAHRAAGSFPDVPSSSLPGLRQRPATTLWCCDKLTATHAPFNKSLNGPTKSCLRKVSLPRRRLTCRHAGSHAP